MAWQTKKLGELLEKTETVNPVLSPQKEFTYIDVSSVSNKTFSIENVNILKGKDAPSRARKQVQYGDIIFATVRPTLQRIARVPEELSGQVCSTGYFVMRPKETLDRGLLFLFLFTESFSKRMEELQKGASYPAVTDADVKETSISFPESVIEQKQIAKKLEEVFEKVATAKSNAEKNLQNSKELFESYLQIIFANPGKDWEEKKFDEIVESNVIGLVKNTKEQSVSKKYKYVKMNNITRDNGFDFSKYTRVDASQSEVEKYSLMGGDFLFNTRNSYELVGKTCIFNDDEENGILFNNNIMRVRFIKSVNSYFINYAFSSRFIIKKLSHLKSGTTNVSAIYYKDLKNLVLPIPSLSEQKLIVKKLDALSAQSKKLEKIYKQKLADLEELKKSVLQQAFTGKL